MPEYVYALHDFLPEHEDEVSFHAGERVEVIEKDDLYGDGWWQGRNLAGKVGLFPQSYTAAAPPDSIAPSSSTSSSTTELATTDSNERPALQALQEEEESNSPTPNNNIHIVAPIPQAAPAIFLNGPETDEEPATTHQRTTSSGEEVMKATMTDVQKAIEQLGRASGVSGDGDEARSFSFASSRGDITEGETDTDYDMSDVDGPEPGGESWHKGARTKLAEKARRAVEEAEKLEAMMGNSRGIAPPIEVELSDESEGEEDYTTQSNIFPRDHPYIPEEDEESTDMVNPEQVTSNLKESSTGKSPFEREPADGEVLVPERDEYDVQTATATRTSFPIFHPPPTPPLAESQPSLQSESNTVASNNTQTQPDIIQEAQRNNERYRESLIALPSPTGSFPAEQSKHNSVASASSTRPSTSALSQPPLTASSVQNTLVEDQVKEVKEKSHPSEWDVNEVVEWLKGKGFDQDVCERFTEQEITGDVLLELDVNLLKTEIGIMAFGKRMRIANAITDLRRPPSIIYSDHPPSVAPHSPLSPPMTQSQGQHSRHQSQAYSHHSYPGSVSGHGHSQSIQGSVAPGPTTMYNGNGSVPGNGIYDRPESGHLGPPHYFPGFPEPVGMGMSASAPAMNGNGVGNGIGSDNEKGRPAHLMLSPSDGALKSTALAVSNVQEEEDEDRGVASEGEAMPSNNMRRRLFGRSYDSSSSKMDSSSRHSKEGSIGASPTIPEYAKSKEKEKDKDSLGSRQSRSKKSTENTTKGTSERLSIFGSHFSGTLGKGRKPPPRYPAAIEETNGEKHSPHSMFTLPRLTSGSRKGSGAPSLDRPSSSAGTTPKTTPKQTTPKNNFKDPKGKETRDPALLRKRTSSAPAPPTEATRNVGLVSPLKQGQSILEQIGEPDHKGWMRKKGDRYNSWKLRYFVLKGPDLYCLRSNSNAETKIKGYVNIIGYKVTVDENVNPGRYGFRIEHDNDKTHYFSSDEKTIIRDWMKAIMKATIGRDYTKPVISSCNIPTIPLMVAQAMNPAPRPPSPTARAATQKALRRQDTSHLSTRDARVLMGLPSPEEGADERIRLPSFFASEAVAAQDEGYSPSSPKSPAPARPSREMRRLSTRTPVANSAEDTALIEWANSHLPMSLQIKDPTSSLCGGLSLLRIAESIKGKPSSPPVLDSAFPQSPTDDKLDGLFQLFDFLLDNDVKMGSVSINDVRQGKRDKILQLLRALKAWEDKRRALASTIGTASSVQSGGFMAPVNMVW